MSSLSLFTPIYLKYSRIYLRVSRSKYQSNRDSLILKTLLYTYMYLCYTLNWRLLIRTEFVQVANDFLLQAGCLVSAPRSMRSTRHSATVLRVLFLTAQCTPSARQAMPTPPAARRCLGRSSRRRSASSTCQCSCGVRSSSCRTRRRHRSSWSVPAPASHPSVASFRFASARYTILVILNYCVFNPVFNKLFDQKYSFCCFQILNSCKYVWYTVVYTVYTRVKPFKFFNVLRWRIFRVHYECIW